MIYAEKTLALSEQPLPAVEVCELLRHSFAALVTSSLLEENIWVALKSKTDMGTLLTDLLLEEPRPEIRRCIADIIRIFCNASSAPPTSVTALTAPSASRDDMMKTFWNAVSGILSHARDRPAESAEILDTALDLFISVARLSPESLSYKTCFSEWAAILLNNEHNEVSLQPYVIQMR